MDYPPRVYHFSLQSVGLVVGSLLLAGHLYALLRPGPTRAWLTALPRSRTLGRILIALAAVWSFWLAANLDLGEFSGFRRVVEIAVPVLAVLTAIFVEEFLAVRALGILALLAAEPVLSAAFLRPEVTRLLLVVLAYAWIVAGMFWVGKPYLLRDAISWLVRSPGRWRVAMLAGIVYGALVLACAVTRY